jgi:archaellum biogenesis protein FlaJ (TadC family)
VANAIAPYIADGGSRYKILFNLGLTATVSGVSLVILPRIANMLFSGIKIA